MYEWLQYGGIVSSEYLPIWNIKLSKNQNFPLVSKKNRVLIKLNLQKRGWNGTTLCVFYIDHELSDHLFVICPYTNDIW
jgi:zinc-binding in reverse transcriptase